MRIRRSAGSSVFPSPVVCPSPSPSPSSCSSSSSCFSSSSTSTHSTISAHSLSSSTSSSSSSSFSLAPAHNPRCQGLDLLVKAVYHVAGSVVGVPYIQKRVIRRRKPAVKFSNLVIRDDKLLNDDQGEVFDGNSDELKKQRRRLKAPSPKIANRRRRRSRV